MRVAAQIPQGVIANLQVTATFHPRARIVRDYGAATPRSSGGTSPTAAHAAAFGVSAHGKACMITPANDGGEDMGGVGGTPNAHGTNGAAGAMVQSSMGQLPGSLVYKRLIQRFQRPMKAPDESSAVLTVRPMSADTKVVDRIESRLDQQLSSLHVLETCATECRAAVKPRLKETVQVKPRGCLIVADMGRYMS